MITIIDYGMGNLGSIKNMLRYLGCDSVISRDFQAISEAGKLILPGVGAFDSGMENLEKFGLKDVLDKKVLGEKTPILGICLGMQLFTESSEEGRKKGLGWIQAETLKFNFKDSGSKNLVPHMGWNRVRQSRDHPLWHGIEDGSRFYFVHSYYVELTDPELLAGACDYGSTFAAAARHDNLFAVQFHPEKSDTAGLRLLENFLNWNGGP